MKITKVGRGGRRAGAGRPKSDRTERLGERITEYEKQELLKTLKELRNKELKERKE